MEEIFKEYRVDGIWDEMISEDSLPRIGCQELHDFLLNLSDVEFEERCNERDRSFMDRGVTFSLSGRESLFPLDPIPRVITGAEWGKIERGVAQRVRALEGFLEDIYGIGEIVLDRVIPRSAIVNSPAFRREAFGIHYPNGVRIPVAGMDVIRDENGELYVLEDNVRTPSGASYVVENRRAMTRIFPELLSRRNVRPVSEYPLLLLSALRAQAPSASGSDPVVVVLTPGVYNSAYFEHSFLARQMGIELVEGRDLVCRDNVVYMRTIEGERRVDVVYRRVDDEYLDPLAFRSDSLIGCAGILNAARAGNVTITSAVGNSIADDKLIYTFVPEMIRYYLGEEPILANVPTYDPCDPFSLEYIEENIESLVVKPVDSSGGYGIVIGSLASERLIKEVLEKVKNHPRSFIAQNLVNLSTVPTKVGDYLEPRHVDLRPFAVNLGDTVSVIPGGLTRVALSKGSLVVNSSQGGGSKDTWIVDTPMMNSQLHFDFPKKERVDTDAMAIKTFQERREFFDVDHYVTEKKELRPQQEIQQQWSDRGCSHGPKRPSTNGEGLNAKSNS